MHTLSVAVNRDGQQGNKGDSEIMGDLALIM